MNIVEVPEEPHPIYEVQDFVVGDDFDELVEWLEDEEHELPDEMGLRFRGGLYWFHTRAERTQFARGMLALSC